MSNKRFVVIVDQSSPPGGTDGFSVFGPYSLMTAEAIMTDISTWAMEGEFDINKVIVSQFHETVVNINAIVSLLKEQQ